MSGVGIGLGSHWLLSVDQMRVVFEEDCLGPGLRVGGIWVRNRG